MLRAVESTPNPSSPVGALSRAETETRAMKAALEAAAEFRGSTSPNPPVGAAALCAEGRLLGVAAHQRAGEPHAEALLLRKLETEGTLSLLHTVVVTLEPCNHMGRTPPCVQALLSSGVKRVVIGTKDPNPRVAGGGMEALRKGGVEVESGVLEVECRALLAPFAKWSQTGKPWVTVKIALNERGTMIPDEGKKTFTSEQSLELAHRLRKRSDALLTGAQTILADQPEFTVRRVPDHLGKSRFLVVLDRRRRVPDEELERLARNGFQILRDEHWPDVLDRLGKMGVLEVLVEAGPTLTMTVLQSGLWDEKIVIEKRGEGLSDRVSSELRSHVYGNY